jgi:hypothetical protein
MDTKKIEVEVKKDQFETIEAKKETKSLRIRTGVKAGPLCW